MDGSRSVFNRDISYESSEEGGYGWDEVYSVTREYLPEYIPPGLIGALYHIDEIPYESLSHLQDMMSIVREDYDVHLKQVIAGEFGFSTYYAYSMALAYESDPLHQSAIDCEDLISEAYANDRINSFLSDHAVDFSIEKGRRE